MKLQPALIFGEHMVLQRSEPIPVWGRSVRDDHITVTLNGITASAVAEAGKWSVVFPAMEAVEQTAMTITSALTGEAIHFSDIAIGEVWLAGGQSNMEFLLKYDELAEEVYQDAADPYLRYFRYPTANFTGCVEKDAYPDDGFWRTWEGRQNRGMFSGPSAYMGRKLRQALGVPVGFVGVNWGGTPAAAWTDIDSIRATPALRPVLDWHEGALKELDLLKYYEASDQPAKEPTPEEAAQMDKFMMGVGLEELFKNGPPPPPPPMDYTPYMPGPRGAIRPAGLYDSMLTKVAPYAIRGAIWYQGEDDDFRGWYGFYDESMKALIKSWRKLWNKDFPFFQVELAPFRGRGITGAKEYYTMREKMRAAADSLPDVHDVCIMDSGDEYNIHVRKKKPVGERLALLALKYAYGQSGLTADSPRLASARREGGSIRLRFSDAGDGLCLKGELEPVLQVQADGAPVSWQAEVDGDSLTLTAEAFRSAGRIQVDFLQLNYCVDPLFSSEGLPAFPFHVEVTE